MPRTKLTKKTVNNNQKRDAQSEAILRELDNLSVAYLNQINFYYDELTSDLDTYFSTLIATIPKPVLSLKMHELENLSHLKKFDMINDHLIESRLEQTKLTSFSSSSTSILSQNNMINRTILRTVGGGNNQRPIYDEGYLTEESGSKSTGSSTTSTITDGSKRNSGVLRSGRAPGRPMGPLLSAKARNRRSKSTSNVQSAQQPLLKAQYLQHQQQQQQQQQPQKTILTNSKAFGSHLSRSKSRTPAQTPAQKHLQTMSVDRECNLVTPKIQLNKPISMLRYPRQGETCISLTGSPVVVQSVHAGTANLNIPYENGIMSLLPTAMNGTTENDFISRMDQTTVEQLKQIQNNLTKIMLQWQRNRH